VHDYDVGAGTMGWDARAREIWGLDPAEPVGYDTFMGGVHPDDREATQAALDASVVPAGSGRYQTTLRVQNPADGTVRWVAATGRALFEGDAAVRLVGTVEDITERHRLEQALLKTELAMAGQDERTRLARDLHDTATQALFAAALKAEALTQSEDLLPGWVADTIEELRRLSRGALAQMRTLLIELRDEPLEQITIDQLLSQLVESMEGRVGTTCQLTIRGEAALPPQLHVTIYRFVQEALNNVSRHAKASSAWVLLETQPGRVYLSVEDDGQGFDPDTVDRSHLGLRSMQERADKAGAAFNISARSGGGTVVTVNWNEERKPSL
jgi:PAS domain S-box-containing protein